MITAYLTFDGNTESAFNFYKSVLGGEFSNLQRFGDTPHAEQMSETDRNKIMHVTLESSCGVLMGNDHLEFMGGPFSAGNNFSLSLHPSGEDEARKLFDGLASGGSIIMPLEKTFWRAYFGMLLDQFGVKWMVNYQMD
jgi:PhnB protein